MCPSIDRSQLTTESHIESGSMLSRGLVAGIGGATIAAGWLPPFSPVLVMLGITLILYLSGQSSGLTEAIFTGFSGALVFFIIVTRPLVSAYGWGGWSDSGGMEVASSGWWLLNILWIVISVWGAVFWSVTFAIYWKLRSARTWYRVFGIIFMWAGIAEWLRSLSHWGFEWGFLGLAFAEVSPVRQWSSVFGYLFLSMLFVGAGAILVEIFTGKPRQKLLVTIGGIVASALVWFGGMALQPTVSDKAPKYRVAAFQFSPAVPVAGATALGISSSWFSVLPKILERGYSLLVLPESISSRAVQLDDEPAAKLGAERQVRLEEWIQRLFPILKKTEAYIAIGVEGIEGGDVYNSTVLLDKDGVVGWQHKVNLVPFAEYLPKGWGFLKNQALTYYEAGRSHEPIKAVPFQIGSFICQEVQYAETTRDLAKNGSNILISGGNDGVFADRRVARIHHAMARIRATEVGRYLVRAMKNGVTSIISPDGTVVSRSPSAASALVAAKVSLSTHQTLWTQFGSWPVLLISLMFFSVFCFSSFFLIIKDGVVKRRVLIRKTPKFIETMFRKGRS